MAFGLGQDINATAECAAADNFPLIRFVTFSSRGKWEVAGKSTACTGTGFSPFSAVCWYFGKELFLSPSLGGEEPVGAAELKDLNRQRSYLRDVATRHGITFSSSVQGACDEIVQYYDELWQSGRDGGSAVPPAVQVQPEAEAGAAAQAVC